MKTIFYLLFIISVLFFSSCNEEEQGEQFHPSHFFDLSDFDTLTSPKDNFYQYVNGNWQNKEPIPKDRGSWGNYSALRLKNNIRIKSLLETTLREGNYQENSNTSKAVLFFKEGMDSAKIEKLGTEPIQPILKEINAIENFFDLQKVVTQLHTKGIHPFFKPTIFQDSYRNNKQSIFLELSGISIHNTDFYALQDSNAIKMRMEYLEHIQRMFKLLGYSDPKSLKVAKTAYTVEEDIAEQFNISIRNHTNEKYYNLKSLPELTDLCQSFVWKQYNREIGVQTDTVIVTNITYFSSIDAIILKNGIEKIKNYLQWRVLHHAAPYLSHQFVTEDFRYFGKKRDGLREQPYRWKAVLKATNKAVGFAVGEMYIANYFPEEAKAEVKEMIDNILLTAAEHIRNIEWMDSNTKKSALLKLNKLTVKIGYPQKFPSYTSLKLGDSYYENIILSNQWLFQNKIDAFNKGSSAKKWIITPQTVNAYYHTLYNEFVITAGILQPPFFHHQADDAVNYGAIGAVIAHEITHGFDNIGRRYNAEGNVQNWWTSKDYYAFKNRTRKLIDQFDHYEPLPGITINGNLTLNENIADLSGLAMAYHALEQTQGANVDITKIDGFTPQQRFFISWATLWRSKTRVEVLRQKLMTETHPPGEYRVNGPLSNFTPFYEAFDVRQYDGMWRKEEDRVQIW
ncbi:M13 family metallopeptidase [Flammeovirga sp. EKP202]|uniref:M13 family metallopeptidase n=1 Tax=Flammeovirga sp. EKP202 TaxID=2770592 RepID=UPI00166004D2|nr:M13 family metallopeptidase [Flammeovirga sp. EKP202]MBD0401030.1 M13 family metallopeptidase [Flammeovirga sp. EKP202]